MAEAERWVVVWRVTTRCNLSCSFCAYDRRLPFARHDADEAFAYRLGSALQAAASTSGRPVHVSFLGGEPFGWEPLPRVARSFAERGLSLGITSNGVSLGSAAARELLLEHFDEVTLSIDGVGPRHDDLRGWPGGFERLATALRALVRDKARRGRGPVLRVNTVLMHGNVAHFSELCRALAELGVQELTFNRLGGRDRPEFYAKERLSSTQLSAFADNFEQLRDELASRGLRLRGSATYVQRLRTLERGEPVPIRDCRPGERFSFIDEHGNVAPCSFTLDSYGEPMPERDLAALPRRFLARQSSRRAHACDDCASTQVFEKFGGA